jgi:hypothetical protein
MALVHRGAAFAALIAACALARPADATVSADNFLLRTTDDLAALCGAQPNDPRGVAAIHECEGFLVGVYRYHEALTTGPGALPRMFCVPQEGAPSRDAAVQMFVDWLRSHPQYTNEQPVDGVFRWAVDTWPCPATRAPRRPTPAARGGAAPAPASAAPAGAGPAAGASPAGRPAN